MKFSRYSFFILNDGTVKCCGYGGYGALGLGNQNSTTVTNLPFTGVAHVVCGESHTFFLMQDGTVKCCGRNSYNQLGLGNTTTAITTVTNLSLTGVKNIVCGDNFTFFLMSNGTVKCCGFNGNGQLGLGNTSSTTTIRNLPFTGVKNIVCGYNFTFFLMQDGTVKCCGDNGYGALGLGHANSIGSAVVNLPFSGVKNIACGDRHSLFLMNDGTVKVCGFNEYGQLGLGYVTSNPYIISTVTTLSITGVKEVVGGERCSFFLMNDGTVKACGMNTIGNLGFGNTTSPISTPTNINLSGIKKVICGQYFTFFLMSDGIVKACGQNGYGQLGLTYTSSSVTPRTNISVTGVEDFNEYTSIPVVILKFLFREGINYKKYTDSWITISSSPTENDFLISGMDSIPNMSIINMLNEPELCVYSSDQDTKTLSAKLPNFETRYVVSMDSITWYSLIDGVWQIITDVYNYGMTKVSLESVTVDQFSQIFTAGSLYIKAVLKSNSATETPFVDSIRVTLPETFTVGSYYIETNVNRYNTLDWNRINSVTIYQTTPSNTNVRYAFSRDRKSTWEVFDGTWKIVSLTNISVDGMTKEQVENITTTQWDTMIWENTSDTLDVLINLSSTDNSITPSVDQITFNYDKIPSPITTDQINISAPANGYRNVLIDRVYVLKLAEGLAFDSTDTDYNFYTTPDRIILRTLDMGSQIGGRPSNIYSVEVINAYENQSYHIVLKVSLADGSISKEFSNYALLPDYEYDEGKTKIELATVFNPDDFSTNAVYPLEFDLISTEKKIFYIRIHPSVFTNVGNKNIQIRLSGRPI